MVEAMLQNQGMIQQQINSFEEFIEVSRRHYSVLPTIFSSIQSQFSFQVTIPRIIGSARPIQVSSNPNYGPGKAELLVIIMTHYISPVF